MHKFAARWLNECPSLAESRKTWQACGSTFRNKTNFLLPFNPFHITIHTPQDCLILSTSGLFPLRFCWSLKIKLIIFLFLENREVRTCKCWCKPCLLLANYRLKKTEHSDPKVQNLKQSVILQENNSKEKNKRRSKKEIRYLILFPNLQSSWWLE